MGSSDLMPSRRSLATRHPWPSLSVAVAALYGVVYVTWAAASRAPVLPSVMADLALVPLTAFGAALAWSVSRHSRSSSRPQWGWALVAAAFGLMAADRVWAVANHGVFAAGAITLASLCADLLLPAALLLLTDPPRGARDMATSALDAAMLLAGGGTVVWNLTTGLAESPAAGGLSGRIAGVAGPVGGVSLVLALAIALFRCPRDARRSDVRLLSGSLAGLLAAHVLAGRAAAGPAAAAVGPLVDTSMVIAVALLALASEQARRRGECGHDVGAAPVSEAVPGLPHTVAVAGYALVIGAQWAGFGRSPLALGLGALGLVGLIATRQVLEGRGRHSSGETVGPARGADGRPARLPGLDVVSIIDGRGTLSYVSPSVRAALGHEASTLEGMSFFSLLDPGDVAEAERCVAEAAETGREVTGRWRMRGRGGWVPTETTCRTLPDGSVRGLVLRTRRESEAPRSEPGVWHGFHDPLTTLANRALFVDRLRHALSRSRRADETLGLLFIDLDQFRAVNDLLGHEAGDALLQEVGRRLVGGGRAFDTIARLGDDEFAVLIDDARGGEGVMAVATRVEQALRDPFVLGGREVMATASIGVALRSPDQSAEDLLRHAALAMNLAKRRGGTQTALFQPELHAAMVSRLELQADLRRALDRGELSVVYQPMHALETQALVGVEALLRWMHPTRGAVAPGTFIPLAEQSGLIVPMGRWVIAQACRDMRTWRQRLGAAAPDRVAVNISGRQLPDPTLFDDIRTSLELAELPATALMLELTESVLLTHTDETLEVMHRLKRAGVFLALDDFGTGYSSLSYLHRLPIDVLKIDRAFVERLPADPGAVALARAIIALGRTLSLRLVAEGIERREQAELLQSLGCDHGQGFLYGAPMTPASLEEYARRAHTRPAA